MQETERILFALVAALQLALRDARVLNESVVDLADPLLTEVAEIVTVCLPVWRSVMSLVNGTMQLEGTSPSTEHLKLLKSAKFEHETFNCAAVCEELQLKGCAAETVND